MRDLRCLSMARRKSYKNRPSVSLSVEVSTIAVIVSPSCALDCRSLHYYPVFAYLKYKILSAYRADEYVMHEIVLA